MDHVSNLQCHNEELEKKVVQCKGQSEKLRFMSKELEETKATLSSHEDKLTLLTKRIDRLEKDNVILTEGIEDRRKENVGLLGELDKSRGQVKELSEKLAETELIWDEKLKELTVSKAELEDRLRACTDLVKELQLLNEEMNSGAGGATESNDEASEALPDFFGNPVIFNHILEQLPNSKLLELSLVSKLWKKKARIVMKRRGNVMALLESNEIRECGQVLEAFAANLQTSNETLYSGMTIRFSSVYGCQGTGALALGAIQSILAGMRGKLKRLSIRLDCSEVCWNARDYCSNFLLVQILLSDFIGDLEHLTLDFQETMEPFIEEFLPYGHFPKLKVLKLYDVNVLTEEETFGSLIRLLLSRAPNLQQICTKGWVSLRENLMEGREGVVHLHETYAQNAMRVISENVIPALRLKKMQFFYNTEPELKLDRFNEKAQSLLRTCCTTTLKRLTLDSVSLVLLMSYGIRLVNVNKLHIALDFVELEQFEPRIQSIMARFDFTYFLPNVTKVTIIKPLLVDPVLSTDNMTSIIEQANNAVQKEPTVTRAGNIKYLGLFNNGSITTSAIHFFAPIFPAIEQLEVWGRVEHALFGSAWELWSDLRLIEVEENKYQRP